MRILGRSLEFSVDCSLSYPNHALHVDLDLKSMPYAVTNLLRNALKYTTSQIVVSAEVVDDYIRIHVDDDGIGIPPKNASASSSHLPDLTVHATEQPAATASD